MLYALKGYEAATLGQRMDQLATQSRPLVLDLDGTLCRTDTLVESLLQLAATRPAAALLSLASLARGRAGFKARIAAALRLDPATLVYNEAVLELARAARAQGRPVYLVTAADQQIANDIAAHFGLFDGVFGSDGSRNLKGEAKAAFLAERFGARNFDYVGDARADLPVWRASAEAYVVAPGPAGLSEAALGGARLHRIGEAPGFGARLATLTRALRVHQWAKNVLVFLPMVAAHMLSAAALMQAAMGFAAFSLCASSVYVLNDLLDLPHDRQHARKRKRPFASGTLSVSAAPGLLAATFGGGAVLACLLPWRFGLLLAVYYACTLSYSLGLKRQAIWDVMMLAVLYALRVLAGGAAIGVVISPWLLAFSLFLFFSLAVVKRQTELVGHVRQGRAQKLSGRGYQPEDLDMLRSMAASSGYMAVLVMALYVDSSAVRVLYRHPLYLWALCPLLLFWISRVLMLSHRGEMHDDPVVFALRDRVSLGVGLVAACICVAGAL